MVSKAKLSPLRTQSAISTSINRPALKAAVSGAKGASPCREQVRIDESRALRLVWKKRTDKGRFARAVWASNDDDLFAHACTSSGDRKSCCVSPFSRKDAKAQRREGVGGLLFESLRLGVLSEAGVRFKVFPPGMGKAAA